MSENIAGASCVLEGLYIGDQSSGVAAARAGFDMVVNLTPNTMGTQPAMKDDSCYHAFAISDGPEPVSTKAQLIVLHQLAVEAAESLRNGGSVLIHCAAGLNRSGLLCALTVREYKKVGGKQAMETVRAKREGSLFNPWFALYLEGLAAPD